MKEKFSSRKLLIAVSLAIIATVMVFTENADFDGWSEFIQWLFGLYVAGNVGEHFATNPSHSGSDRTSESDI